MGFFNLFSGNENFDLLINEAKKDKNAIILDVRTPEEFSEGHVPDAVNIPLDKLSSAALDKLKKHYVYCRSGARSEAACDYLKKHGYEAVNAGGIISYSGVLEK